MAGFPERADAAARLVVARSLDLDRVTAEVVAALREAGVRPIVLKGPTLAAWLYRNGSPRGYVDSDLLVAPSDVAAAGNVLARLGFEQLSVEAPHARTWARPRTGHQIDLHFSLPAVSVPPSDVWREVVERTETMSIGGVDVEVLPRSLRALLVALHATHHGPAVEKPLVDLRQAVEQVPESIWRDAALASHRLGAVAPFAIGLRLLPEGAAIAERLGLPSPELIASVKALGSRAPLALGVGRLVEAQGPRAKLALLARELVPTAEFMRWWSPLARRGPIGLALAYPVRIAWLLRHAAPSLRAWRQSRKRP